MKSKYTYGKASKACNQCSEFQPQTGLFPLRELGSKNAEAVRLQRIEPMIWLINYKLCYPKPVKHQKPFDASEN